MNHLVKSYGYSFLGAMGTGGVMWLNHINVVIASLCGLVTLTTLLLALRDRNIILKKEHISLTKQALELCKECQTGDVPREICPLDILERPITCPLKKKV